MKEPSCIEGGAQASFLRLESRAQQRQKLISFYTETFRLSNRVCPFCTVVWPFREWCNTSNMETKMWGSLTSKVTEGGTLSSDHCVHLCSTGHRRWCWFNTRIIQITWVRGPSVNHMQRHNSSVCWAAKAAPWSASENEFIFLLPMTSSDLESTKVGGCHNWHISTDKKRRRNLFY